jgi:antitoxin component of MazEF toxin-antitoxin module
MAKLADGQYMEIAATGGAIIVATPYDKELAELSTRLNGTYLAYGPAGQAAAANQAAQDANAARQNAPTAADRAAAKSSRQYNNARWDMIDALKNNKDFDVKKVKEEELPEEMRKMTPAEREAHVRKKAAERAEIQKQIQEMAAKRDQFIKEETQKKGLTGDKAFETAVRESVVKQAQDKGFAFEQDAKE